MICCLVRSGRRPGGPSGRARADHRRGGDGRVGHRQCDRAPAAGQRREDTPRVTRAWVDAGFKHDVAIHGAFLGIDVQVVKRSDNLAGFVPVAKRWVVEQTHGTLMLHRRLTREYESQPASSLSRTFWASTANLIRRLTGTSTPSWRAPAGTPRLSWTWSPSAKPP
jgi:hypothetical protein